MKLQLTGIGLLTASIFGLGAWRVLENQGSAGIVGTLVFFALMSLALSQRKVGPVVGSTSMLLGAIFGIGVLLLAKDIGLALFIFSLAASAFSFVFK